MADLVVLPTVEREQLQIGEEVIDVRSGEGLPRSILEAMHCGKPVVATTVAGTSEQIINGETGFLAPPANPEALAEAILKVLEMGPEARERMGEHAIARVREKFSTERMVAQTVDLYRDVAGKQKPQTIPLAVVAEH
jgi:glycosyltransferase involved in cell wall biosynthesis